MLRATLLDDRKFKRLSAAFAGVTLVEAKKEIMAPSGVVRAGPRVLRDFVTARREGRATHRNDG